MYLYITCNVKLSVQNKFFKIINQQKFNDMLFVVLGKGPLP
jgi:hypothetical protein